MSGSEFIRWRRTGPLSVPAPPTRPATRPAAQPHVRLSRQVVLVAMAVAAYFGVRGATEAAVGDALGNAARVLAVERYLGMDVELTLQSWTAAVPALVTVMNWVYIWGHWPVIVVTLIWLARSHPAVYYRTRNAMLLSGAIGLVVFITFPVAPPRLTDLGMVDTVSVGSDAYRVLQPTMFTNQYAAMPSLHVGWDLLIGLAIALAARHTLVRAIGAAMPVAMTVSVVLTANHYIIDAVAGAALTTTCWVLYGWWQRRSSGAAGQEPAELRSLPDSPVRADRDLITRRPGARPQVGPPDEDRLIA